MLALGANYFKMVQNIPILPAEITPRNLVLSNIWVMVIFAKITQNKYIIRWHSHGLLAIATP